MSDKAKIRITVNGLAHEGEAPPRMLLVDYIRDVVGLKGTRYGCDTSNCGSCTIVMDGRSAKSCTFLAVQADGREVTTIEGLADGSELNPLQAAFQETHALQCGFCTSGMVMSAHALLARNPAPVGGGDSRRDHRQPVPLHRLPAGHRGGAVRGPAHERRRRNPMSAGGTERRDAYPRRHMTIPVSAGGIP